MRTTTVCRNLWLESTICFPALRLERLFLGRHKLLHFESGIAISSLTMCGRCCLTRVRCRDRIFKKKTVERIVEDHLKQGLNYTMPIHKLITLELLHRLFLDA